MPLEPLDVVSWTSDRYGYDGKTFEINSHIDPLLTGTPRLSLREVDAADYDWDAAFELPVATVPITVTQPAPQSVDGFAVQSWGIPDADGIDIRPALRLTWNGDQPAVRGVQWEVRIPDGANVTTGSTHDVEAGQIIISDGILPARAYEVRAKFVIDRPTLWTGWAIAITPDLRPGLSDLSDAVAAAISEAASDATQALTNAATVQANLSAEVASLDGDILTVTESTELASRAGVRGDCVIRDPLFAEYDETGSMWVDFGAGPLAIPNEVYPVGQTLKFTPGVDENIGSIIANSAGWTGQQNADAYVIEIDFTLVSGSILGAGVLLDWDEASGYERVSRPLSDMLREDVTLGKVTTAQSVFIRPAGVTNFINHELYLMGSFSTLVIGARPARDLRFHRLNIRVATDEELGSGEVGAQIAAAVATETSARATDVESLTFTLATQTSTISDISATVIQQGVTLATVDDVVQAMTGLTAEVTDIGGMTYISGIRATSYSDPDGTGGSLLELIGDNVVADGTLSVGKLVSGRTNNQILNSQFYAGLTGWQMAGGGSSVLSVRPAGSPWAGEKYPTLMLFQGDNTNTGFNDFRSVRVDAGGNEDRRQFPVEAGKWYGVAVKASMHRCTGLLRVLWRSANSSFISSSDVVVPEGSFSSDNPEEWPNRWIHGQAPVGAEYGQFSLRKYATLSDTSSFAFIHRPYSFESHAAATEPPQYAPEGVTVINGGQIVADTLVFRQAIVGDTIQSDNYSSDMAGISLNFATGAAEIYDLSVTNSMIVPGAASRRAYLKRISNITITSTYGVDTAQDIFGYTADIDVLPFVGSPFAENAFVVVISGLGKSNIVGTSVIKFYLEGRVGTDPWEITAVADQASAYFYDNEVQHFTCTIMSTGTSGDLNGYDEFRITAACNTGADVTLYTNLSARFEQFNR